MNKVFAKVSSQLMTEDRTTELKLKQQHYIMIFPQHLIEQLGIKQNELIFQLVLDNSNKLTLIGPKVASPPKSEDSSFEKGGFVI